MHDLAALPDGLAWHDDPKRVRGVTAGGVDTVARTDSGNDQRIDAQGGQVLYQVGRFERRSIFLPNDSFIRPAIQTRI